MEVVARIFSLQARPLRKNTARTKTIKMQRQQDLSRTAWPLDRPVLDRTLLFVGERLVFHFAPDSTWTPAGPPFYGLRAQQYFTKVILWILRPTVQGVRPDSGILWTLCPTVWDKKSRPPLNVRSQRESCEARCGVGAGKSQRCRFLAVFEISAGFFRVCKNGLKNVTYLPPSKGEPFFAEMEKKAAQN